MQSELIECVPNFSEAREPRTIAAIAGAIASVPGTMLLGVDPGPGANRTVFTFAGEKKPVVTSAYLAIEKALELIDMTKHHGAHPRIGACDVCPFVPLEGSTMESCIQAARELASRAGKNLALPVYLYGRAALDPSRVELADLRRGQYEGLRTRIENDGFLPDFGPASFNERAGATAIGAREVLVAYNVSLETTSQKVARKIASRIREQSADAGLKRVKAIGWYMEEYGLCQVSTNILDYRITSLKSVFDTVKQEAAERGVAVPGSEVVGLLPLAALAGEKGSASESHLKFMVEYLGLNLHKPFRIRERVLEYRLADLNKDKS
ncbi:MAG TPA: glutamate formimidoyltransferase [Candidatus Melainabacteria bacterium]|nr:glutamate formimidoyltransferase [Candidatus Melainabacteria bacterium]